MPEAVWNEVVTGDWDDPAAQQLGAQPWPVRLDVAVSQRVAPWELGAGETAVLSHALAHPPLRAVIDDLDARRCAQTLGIPMLGTGGLLVLAKQRGLIESVGAAIEKLQLAGLWLSYDRIAGYFRFSLFEVAGEALSQVAGTVRIICNSDLDPQDLNTAAAAQAALRRNWCAGRPEDAPPSAIPRYRALYEALTSKKIEIRVLPDLVFGLIHGKAGVARRADGSATAFLGSVNESASAWKVNYELEYPSDGAKSLGKCPRRIGLVVRGLGEAVTQLLSRRYTCVIVDEAHRARRRKLPKVDASPDEINERADPNKLMVFLRDIGPKTKSMLLATATPVPLHPVEAWDLLHVLSHGHEGVLGGSTHTSPWFQASH